MIPEYKGLNIILKGEFMYCGKCGTKLPDDAAFCTSCGAPTGITSEAANHSSSQNQTYQTPESNQFANKTEPSYGSQASNTQPVFNNSNAETNACDTEYINKKRAVIFGSIAGVIAVAVVIILFTLFGGGHKVNSTPEKAISQLEKAFNDLNVSEIADCFDSSTREAFSDYTDSLDYDLSSLAKSLGADINFELNPTNYEYSTDNGNDYCDVTIDIVLSVSFLGQSADTTSDMSLTYIKEGNDWKISGNIDELEDLISSLNSLGF